VISINQALKEIEVGATCFMIVSQGEKKSSTENIKSIAMVDEYAYVFPDRMAPYRMALVELVELKKQIEDLLEKKFI